MFSKMVFRILTICIIISSCVSNRMMQTDLYFGQAIPTGGMVTEAEWKEFTEKHIARIFSKGSTVFATTGSWYDPVQKKLITEPSYIVSCVYKKSSRMSEKIDSLRLLYINAFHQQAVLRIDKKVRADF
jgi:hypothetical protein